MDTDCDDHPTDSCHSDLLKKKKTNGWTQSKLFDPVFSMADSDTVCSSSSSITPLTILGHGIFISSSTLSSSHTHTYLSELTTKTKHPEPHFLGIDSSSVLGYHSSFDLTKLIINVFYCNLSRLKLTWNGFPSLQSLRSQGRPVVGFMVFFLHQPAHTRPPQAKPNHHITLLYCTVLYTSVFQSWCWKMGTLDHPSLLIMSFLLQNPKTLRSLCNCTCTPQARLWSPIDPNTVKARTFFGWQS